MLVLKCCCLGKLFVDTCKIAKPFANNIPAQKTPIRFCNPIGVLFGVISSPNYSFRLGISSCVSSKLASSSTWVRTMSMVGIT